MVKVKFDVSGSNPEDSRGGNVPKPGVYRCKIKEVRLGFKKDEKGKPDKTQPRIEPVYVIDEGTNKTGKGFNLFEYISVVKGDPQEWKFDQFLQAVGLATDKKRKGEIDLDKLKGVLVKVRVKADSYEGNPTAKPAAVMPMDEDDEEDEVDDDDELDEEDEDSEDDEDEDEDDEDEEEDEDEDEDEDEEDDEDEDEDEDEEDDDEEDDEVEEEEEPAKPAKKGKTAKAAPAKAAKAAKAAPAKATKKAAPAKEAPAKKKKGKKMPDDYNDWDLTDLKAECETREIEAKGSKTALVKRLEKWDVANPF